MLALSQRRVENRHMEEPKNPNKWLVDARAESTKTANAAEETISKQIILINSGGLALVGGFVINHIDAPSLAIQILLTIAAAMLITSLVAALVQLVLTHRLFLASHKILDEVISVAKHMTQPEFEKYYEDKLKTMQRQTSSAPYWIELVSFGSGAILITILIVLSIW